jgi:hypothetical protein
MWVFIVNGLVALGFGLWSGRLQKKWLPVKVSELIHDVREALSFHLAHDDITVYNVPKTIAAMTKGTISVENGMHTIEAGE